MTVNRKKLPSPGTARHKVTACPPKSGLRASQLNKNLGQHLLKNPGIVDKIVAASDIKSSDTVLEIGCGTGNLTVKLLPVAKKVIAFDIDDRMVEEIRRRCLNKGYQNLQVQVGDVLRSDLGHFQVCAANLPYQISSPFLFKLLSHRPLFRCAVLMFQKEFAERLCARPGESSYSRLAVNVQLFANVQRVCTVKAANFNPPPKVDSMIVKLTPKMPQPQIDFKQWDGLLRICFMCKRKTLHSNFTTKSVLQLLQHNYLQWVRETGQMDHSDVPIKDRITQILEDLNLSSRRSCTCTADEFLKLLLACNQQGFHFANTTADHDDNNSEDANLQMLDD